MTLHAPILDIFAALGKTNMPLSSSHDWRVTKNASPALRNLSRHLAAHLASGVSRTEFAQHAGFDVKTLGRIVKMENEPSLDKVSGVAKALGRQPWEVIHPDGGIRPIAPTLGIEQALVAIQATFASIPPAQRTEAAEMLHRLALVPDSSETMSILFNLLGSPALNGQPPLLDDDQFSGMSQIVTVEKHDIGAVANKVKDEPSVEVDASGSMPRKAGRSPPPTAIAAEGGSRKR